MIYKVHKEEVQGVTGQLLKCINTQHKDSKGQIIGKVIGLTQGKLYVNLSDVYNTPSGTVTVRNDNSAIVRLLSKRFSQPNSYIKRLTLPFSDTEILQNIIQIHEGAE